MNNEETNKTTQNANAAAEPAKAAPAVAVAEKGWLAKTADCIEEHPVTAACVTFTAVCLASCLICWAAGGYESGNVGA